MKIKHIQWDGACLRLLDQRLLPNEERFVSCTSADQCAAAIRDMVVRGAPAIGVSAAYGLALEARRCFEGVGESGDEGRSFKERQQGLRAAASRLREARPTAVNLMWAVDRMMAVFNSLEGKSKEELVAALCKEAETIDAEDLAMCKKMGEFGGALLPDKGRVLTHCNAGALATAGYGTALGVIRSGIAMGKALSVFADETRPYLQGARLTAYELHADGIEVEVLPDNAAGHLMSRGEIQAVVVGSDRIAANGDVANKIGTYTVAVLAARHGVPFYVAAPTSTVDLETPTGEAIPIEERSAEEVLVFAGRRIAPIGVGARHPAFDVTPAELVTAIITERGVARAPYGPALRAMLKRTA